MTTAVPQPLAGAVNDPATQDVIDSLITEATDYYKAVHFDFCDYSFIK